MKRVLSASVITILALAALLLAVFSNNFFISATVNSAPDGYIRLEVTRDTWVSSYQGETEGSNGGADRLKVKGYQEMVLLDIDPGPISGRVIERATLHVRIVNPEISLKRVGISTISAEWTEGNGSRYRKVRGASSFRWRAYPDVPWIEGKTSESGYSDLTQVMFSEGGTFWSHADATPPDANGWQSIKVDPKILAARAAGLSCGFVVFDDTGTEIVRSGENGENVKINLFPNRFFYSRERNAASAPYFTVQLADKDVMSQAAPSAPMNLRAEAAGLAAGDAIVKWEIPAWDEEKIIGFRVKVNGSESPRSLIPSPPFADNDNSQTVIMRLRDFGIKPGQATKLEVTAVNETGQTGNAATVSFFVSDEKFSIPAEFSLSDEPAGNAAAAKEYTLQLSDSKTATLAILDELDKVSANGELIPKRQASYFASNHIWNASENRIRLFAARNEFTGFQIYLSGDIPLVTSRFQWDGQLPATAAPLVGFSRFGYVSSPIGNVPDPVIPLASDAVLNVNGNISIFCEVFIPKFIKPGVHHGTLSLLSGDDRIYSANVELTVWDFELPDTLSFLPEMNCYSLPENERDYYRLAQLHRTFINRVPYSHRGTVYPGCAPEWNPVSRTFDWSAWDKRYGAYFDGSAFADLPRGKTPIEAFFLPIFENFPANIFTHHNGSEWADEAFTDEYKETFQTAAREFAKHIIEQNWNQTSFLFFLNNKMNYKRNGWSRASSPWLLDEPQSFQDFAALKFFGELFLKSVNSLPYIANLQAKSPIQFRADVSYPQWQRNSLDRILGVNVVGGGAFRQYNRVVIDRKERFNQTLYTYGTTCEPEEGAYQPVIWSLDAWSLGADGIIPWQTIGNADSWKSSDALALFYPKPRGDGEDMPDVLASLRLKGYRRGQQDIEYLTLLQKKLNRSRHDIEGLVRAKLNLVSKNTVNSSEDAGTLSYDAVSARDLWQFRMNVAHALQAK